MNKAGYKTLSFSIPVELHQKVNKPVELWKDVSAIFSELVKTVGRIKWNEIKNKHKNGYDVIKEMP